MEGHLCLLFSLEELQHHQESKDGALVTKVWCLGDASQYVHELVQQVASARLEIADYEADIFGPPKSIAAQLAGLVGNTKRRLSITAVRLDCSSTASNFLGQGAVGTGQ